MSKRLSCVYKMVERCNISCTYCYFFFGGDESYKNHPPYASFETTQAFANFLLQAVKDLELDSVSVGFHGGEPLMIGPQKLAKMCDIFLETIGEAAEVVFTLQTNGMLINDAWIDVFDKYNINPGISLDGPKSINDKYRLDKKGRSTYESVVKGIKTLAESKLNYNPGILSVINPKADGKKIFRHFVDDLNIRSMDFLLPHSTHDAPLPGTAKEYGQFLIDVFDEWTKDDNPDIKIRFFQDALDCFSGGYSSVYGRGYNEDKQKRPPLLNVSSNGDLGPVSELMTTSSEIMHTGLNIHTHTAKELLELPVFETIDNAIKNVSDKCKQCCWQRVCGGGDIVTRYSKEKGFNNPSTLCEGLFDFYAHVATYMLNHGIKEEDMLKNIGIQAA